MTEELKNMLGFSRMLHNLRLVERAYFANGTERNENDSEHSFNLALLAWYIIDSHELALDKDLTLKYALLHDIPEVYAGDTYIYAADEKYLASKDSREMMAREKLRKEFPEFDDFHALLDRYMKREDAESRFVYALDKLLPLIDIFLDKGRSWQHHKVSLQMLLEKKLPKVKVSPEVEPYFQEMIGILTENRREIFNEE